MSAGEIIVVPFPHPGHLFPAIELCRRLAEGNFKISLILPSATSSPPPPSLHHPLIQTVDLPISDPIHIDPSFLDITLPAFLHNLLAKRRDHSSLPICAVVDEMINWIVSTFHDFNIPAVSFFTSSAITSALEHAVSQITASDLTGNTAAVPIPGLPDDCALTSFDLKNHHNGDGVPPFRGKEGRSRRPRDIASLDGAVGLIFNTCVDLEQPFLEYVSRVADKPVWAVGPLLPDRFWSSLAGPIRDLEARPGRRRDDGLGEEEVLSWMDSKPRGSVVYVSFGSLVGPSDAELEELAGGLEESGKPFIWVIQPGARQHDPDGRPIMEVSGHAEYCLPQGLEERGMVIRGWAPQLMILSHPSVGVYVCHCGWNSTLEALASGVPVLAWPVRGDQMNNARLLVTQLRVALPVRAAPGMAVRRADMVRGIEKLVEDQEIRKRAASVRSLFAEGLPRSSAEALDAFLDKFSSGCRHK